MLEMYARFIAEYFGKEKQLEKLKEELKELSDECDRVLKEDTKELDYSFLEEVADVFNMLEQLKYLFNDKKLNEKILQIRKEKNERTLNRLEEGEFY